MRLVSYFEFSMRAFYTLLLATALVAMHQVTFGH